METYIMVEMLFIMEVAKLMSSQSVTGGELD